MASIAMKWHLGTQVSPLLELRMSWSKFGTAALCLLEKMFSWHCMSNSNKRDILEELFQHPWKRNPDPCVYSLEFMCSVGGTKGTCIGHLLSTVHANKCQTFEFHFWIVIWNEVGCVITIAKEWYAGTTQQALFLLSNVHYLSTSWTRLLTWVSTSACFKSFLTS